jgi:hypothetical protein
MEHSLEYGFLMACWIVPMILTDEGDMPDVDVMTEDDGFANEEFLEAHRQRMAVGVNDAATKRLTELFEFGVKHGLI